MIGAAAPAPAVVVVVASRSGSWDVRAATARARPESSWGSARNDAASVPLDEAYVAPAGSVMFVLFVCLIFAGCASFGRVTESAM